jgi:hypothetical protein
MLDPFTVDTFIVTGFVFGVGLFIGWSLAVRRSETNTSRLEITTQLGSRSVTWTYSGPASGISTAVAARDRSLTDATATEPNP